MVQTFLQRHGWGITLTGALIAGSNMVNNQVAKIPLIGDAASKFGETLEGLIVNNTSWDAETASKWLGAAATVAGVTALYSLTRHNGKQARMEQAGLVVKKEKKKQPEQNPEDKNYVIDALVTTGRGLNWVGKRAVVPLAGTALLLAGVPALDSMYEAAAGKLESLMNLKEYIGPAATTMAATAAGMATVIGSQKLYKVWSKAKHDPIRQVIEVDGYSTVSIPKWYRNFFIGRKMKIFGKDIRPRKYENTRGNMRVVGEIRVKDYKNMGTKKDKAYVCLHIDKEPHKVRGDMSPVGIFATFNHLKTYIADSLDQLKAEDGSCAYMDDENKPHIGIDNLSDLMEKSQAYETLSEDKHQKLSPGDVSIIHKALLSRQDLIPESGNVLDVDVNKLTEYINTAVGTDGGRFSRVLYREGSDSTGQWVPYIYIEENEGATKSISQDANGTDWAKRGKCNMYLTWSSKMHANVGEDAGGADEAGADEVGEDIGAADESGSEAGPSDDPDMGGAGGDDYETLKRNHIRKLDKPLGRAIANWGDVYKVIFKGESYDMIRCPFDSGPLPKGKAIRDSYIVMHGDSLVARIEESAVVTKWWPIQNHDWEGHVFDKSLAKSTDFGMLVGGLTHYLQNRNLYDKNACRKQIDLASTSIPQDEIA